MSELIEHTGRVVGVSEGCVHVAVEARSACAACAARSACGMSESAEKRVEVFTADAEAYAPGEAVTVSIRRGAGLLAVGLGYVGALAVLLAVLAVCVGPLGLSEGTAAVASMGGVAVYYGALWLLRRRIEAKIHIKIHKS